MQFRVVSSALERKDSMFLNLNAFSNRELNILQKLYSLANRYRRRKTTYTYVYSKI